MSFETVLLTVASILIVITLALVTLATALLIILHFRGQDPNFRFKKLFFVDVDELPPYVQKLLKFSPIFLKVTSSEKELGRSADVYFKVFLIIAPLVSIAIIWFVLIMDFLRIQMVLILLMWIQLPIILYLGKVQVLRSENEKNE